MPAARRLGLVLTACAALVAGCSPRDDAGPPSPLVEAARVGDVARIRALLAAGADVEEAVGARKGFGNFLSAGARQGGGPAAGTPLMAAIQAGQVEAVAALLEAGASTEARNAWNRTPWDLVAGLLPSPQGEAMLKALLARSQDGLSRQSALTLASTAAGAGEAEVVRWMLPHLDAAAWAPVFCAAMSGRGDDVEGQVEVLTLLQREIGESLPTCVPDGAGRALKFAWLLELQPECAARRAQAGALLRSFLWYASKVPGWMAQPARREDTLEAVGLLMEAGADPGEPGPPEDRTALEHARALDAAGELVQLLGARPQP